MGFMKTIYLLYDGEYEDRDVICIFETREQAELFCDVYGYYKSGIEERKYFEKDDEFPTSNLWYRVTPIALFRLANYDNPICIEDIEYINNPPDDIDENLNIFLSLYNDSPLVEFNVKADSRNEAQIKANKRCKELQDYFKSLLEKK